MNINDSLQAGVDQNVIRILVTNDNHIGYKEDDRVRKRDALVTFEEILQIASVKKVDMILHSGDLFDDSRPNRFWINSVCALLRRYCFGDRELALEHLRTEYSTPLNFEDENVNIDLPIFMTHGNHDDPGGEMGDSATLACADLLQTVSLVNYFCKQSNVEEEIEVKPILLQKGTSKLALYGLGNIRDDRLYRMFQAKKVKFLSPPENSGYFNLMSIHQNRFRGNVGGVPCKSCVHATFLPSFLNLVVWAHEHECIASPEESLEAGFHILQSGSSIATSLTIAEQVPKHVFLVEICGDKFRTTPIPLLTVRPLIIDELILPQSSQPPEKLFSEKVDLMVTQGREEYRVKSQARSKWLSDHSLTCMFDSESPELPLVRLKVHPVNSNALMDSVGNSNIANQKFGRLYLNKVANPDSILQFMVKRRVLGSRDVKSVVQLELEDAVPTSSVPLTSQDPSSVQDLIFNYMGGISGEGLLDVLVEPDFNLAVQDFVHKGDLHAIEKFVKSQIDEIGKISLESGVTDSASFVQVSRNRAIRIRNERLSAAMAAADPLPPPPQVHTDNNPNTPMVDSEDDDDDMFRALDILDPMEDDKIVPIAKKPRTFKDPSPSVGENDDDEVDDELSDDVVFSDIRNQPKPKRKAVAAKPRANKKTMERVANTSSQQTNSILAAFLSQAAAPAGKTESVVASTSAASATSKRPWSRK